MSLLSTSYLLDCELPFRRGLLCQGWMYNTVVRALPILLTMGMGRCDIPARYILLLASAPVQKPTMRPAYPLSNTMLKVYLNKAVVGAGRLPSLLE